MEINKQKGVVLLVSLVFLLIITIAGISAMRLSTVEEKMTGNFSDRNVAFQAAEAALRDGEAWIDQQNFSDVNFLQGCTEALCFNSNCDDGLCFGGDYTPGDCEVYVPDVSAGERDIYQDQEIWLENSRHRNATSDIDGAANDIEQAKYVVEFMCFVAKDPENPDAARFDSGQKYGPLWEAFYRVTALGYGRNPNTRVMLQSTYRRD
jgi:type IV pilus assembly protein PilX